MGQRTEFVAIVGLPRSGTTLLTALLDQHREFCLYYEPWNASPGCRPVVSQTLDEFRVQMHERFGGVPASPLLTTGFKETTTNEGTMQWAVDTTRALSGTCVAKVIWIQRNPLHCLLSKLEGARRWWGHEDAKMSRAVFEGFLIDTQKSYETLGHLVREVGGMIVRYERLATDARLTMSELMSGLGAEFDSTQLDFHRGGVDPKKVMGDPSLIESPGPVSVDPTRARADEVDTHRVLIDAVLAEPRFTALMRDIEAHQERTIAYFEP